MTHCISAYASFCFGCVNSRTSSKYTEKMAKSKKELSFFQRVVAFFKWLWLQYQVVSCTYMMEDWEARIYNTTVLIILCTAVYTTYLYLPSHVMMIVNYVGYLFSSDDTSQLLPGSAAPETAAAT